MQNHTIDIKIKLNWCQNLAFAIDYLHLHLKAHKKVYTNNIFVTNANKLILGEIGFTSRILNLKNEILDQNENILYSFYS